VRPRMEWIAWPISWKRVVTSEKDRREGFLEPVGVEKSQINAMVGSCIIFPSGDVEMAIPSLAASEDEEKIRLDVRAASSNSEDVICREQRSVKCAG